MTSYFELSHSDKADVLSHAVRQLGRSGQVLEKDIWVCWALRELFELPDRPQMAFKGGTSLSKAYKIIERFSEDVDVTIDYRGFDQSQSPLDEDLSNTRRKALSSEFRLHAIEVVRDVIEPYFRSAGEDVDASIEIEEEGETLTIRYRSAVDSGAESIAGMSSYIKEGVLLEFGGRNITDPCTKIPIETDIAHLFSDIEFPTAAPEVLNAERTFWEKLTAMHSECNRPAFKSGANRLSRHWYDVYKLIQSGIGESAIDEYDLLKSVVDHKKAFYHSGFADYDACLRGEFNLFPDDLKLLEDDYDAMNKAGMFFNNPPSFIEIHQKLSDLKDSLTEIFGSVAYNSCSRRSNDHCRSSSLPSSQK